jgi:HD superfamily phosphohydrolase
MSELVYPGAFHSRFSHLLGAMHLMTEALKSLQSKGHLITEKEFEAAQIAILLHDIGHGPFSHVLEYTMMNQVEHEYISEKVMGRLNLHFEGKLSLAIEIFKDNYHRKFFHQLVSGQLDMDRMDYLNRDSFYTGVAEGNIGAERIIKMLNVVDNELVVEEKGLLSVENFLTARRLMYWQVYLHKTAICAEAMLQKIFVRVKFLIQNNGNVFLPENLKYFFENVVDKDLINKDTSILDRFLKLDDYDIWYLIKANTQNEDKILSFLCSSLVDRRLFKIRIEEKSEVNRLKNDYKATLDLKKIDKNLQEYLFRTGEISNSGYASKLPNINILMKNGIIKDVSEASDLPTIKAMSNIVKKYYICFANDVYLHEVS